MGLIAEFCPNAPLIDYKDAMRECGNLYPGERYPVLRVSMGQSMTNVWIDNEVYNSIYFKFYENDAPIDIYRDKRYNPYLHN